MNNVFQERVKEQVFPREEIRKENGKTYLYHFVDKCTTVVKEVEPRKKHVDAGSES